MHTARPNTRQLVVSMHAPKAQLTVSTACALYTTARQDRPNRVGLGTVGCARCRQAESTAIVSAQPSPERRDETSHVWAPIAVSTK